MLCRTEGDVIALAEARSLTYRRRLTIIGGTPLLSDTSRAARLFAESDQRICGFSSPPSHLWATRPPWPYCRPRN